MTDFRIDIAFDIHDKAEKLSNVFGDDPNWVMGYSSFSYRVVLDEIEGYFDFINTFMDILEPNLHHLDVIGIKREWITIWYEKDHEAQNNFEFEPQDLKRLGDNGIKLCISVY